MQTLIQFSFCCYLDFSKLLTKYNIKYSDLERECDDGLFNDIIKDIESYSDMAKGLRISEAKFKTICESKEDENGKCLAILKAWKRKHGSDGTYLILVEAFLAMDDRTVAERIIKYVKRLPPEEGNNILLVMCSKFVYVKLTFNVVRDISIIYM